METTIPYKSVLPDLIDVITSRELGKYWMRRFKERVWWTGEGARLWTSTREDLGPTGSHKIDLRRGVSESILTDT